MSEPKWLDPEELNLSSSAFAENSDGFQDIPKNHSTIQKDDDFDPTEGVTEFDDLHLNEGLDAIVRVNDPPKRRRAGMNRLYCVLFAVMVLVAITTMSVMIPNSREDESHSINAYEEQVNKIRQAYLEKGILNEKDNVAPGSPRYEAMKYVAIQSETRTRSASLSEEITSYPFIARYVIALTLYTLRGPWFTFDNSSICELFHKDSDKMSGIRCSEEGLPTSLNLENHGLSGQIPSELGLLTTVQHLNFANNSLVGTLPPELCKLSELVTLKMGWNAIGGKVPACLGKMANLQLLNLNFNQMTGALPEGVFTNMRQMYLNANNFSQALPALVSNMKKLEGFSARENKFYGNVDAAFNQHAGQLVMLDVSANKRLGGAFPTALLQNAPNLEILSLGDNAISGDLAWTIPRNEKLRVLSLYSNKLKGRIPPAVANLTALTHLILSDNALTGSLPATLPASLTSLFLSGNAFSPGPIPESWASLKNMVAFRMGKARRSGNLPGWIGQNWTQVAVLDVGGNGMEGTIPFSWGKLTKLEYLFLTGNQKLSGSHPASFSSSTILKKVLLFQTNITGDWEFVCPNSGTKTAILGSHIEDCSCCVVCDEWTCARAFMNVTDESIVWEYRNYWGV